MIKQSYCAKYSSHNSFGGSFNCSNKSTHSVSCLGVDYIISTIFELMTDCTYSTVFHFGGNKGEHSSKQILVAASGKDATVYMLF